MRRAGFLILGVLIGVVLAAVAVSALRLRHLFDAPDPASIATGSLESLRQQNRLTVFAARYVAVVTSEQDRFLLSARKTLIMPGSVRYDLDLARLRQQDLSWDAATRTLTVMLPPVTVSPPAVDLPATREYSGGGLLMALTDAEHDLDAANRAAAVRQLAAEAAQPLPMKLAREAAVAAVERSFALPLKAAGVDATVVARVPA